MRHRRLRRPSKTQIFAILMLLSLALLFVPTKFLGPIRHVTQLVAMPQWLARETAQKATEEIRQVTQKSVPGPTHDQVLRKSLALEHENASLRQQMAELQATVEAVGRLRKAGLPQSAILIPARILAADAAIGRDSLLIGKVPKEKAKKGAWVASRVFIDAGSEVGVENQLAVLARECLIGWIEEAGPFAARVVLLSDLGNKATRVQITPNIDSPDVVTSDGKAVDFTLKGDGPNRMKIPDLPREFVDSGKVRVGYWVISNPNDPKLPIPVSIGQIAELNRVKEKPVYYEAVIQPGCDAHSLREVFVVDMAQPNRQLNSSRKKP